MNNNLEHSPSSFTITLHKDGSKTYKGLFKPKDSQDKGEWLSVPKEKVTSRGKLWYFVVE